MSLASIEQNDVDISRLFSYTSEAVLETPDGQKITFYLKVLGDADNNISKTKALRASKKFRDQLNDLEWEDRELYIPVMRGKNKSDILEIVLGLEMSAITMMAMNEIQVAYPQELSGDATLEDQEKYQEEVDSYSSRFEDALTKEVDKQIKQKRIAINKITKDDIILKYETALINQTVQRIYENAYFDQALHFATYTDKEFSVLAFKTAEDFENAPTYLKEALIHEYGKIEIGGSELKK